MNIFNWFGSNKLIGKQADRQHADQQRLNITTPYADVFSNQYYKKNLSYNYNLCFLYYYNITPLNVAVNKISQDCSKVDLVENGTERSLSLFNSNVEQSIRSAVVNLLLTGNVFLRVFGTVNQKVRKMQVLDSRVIEFKEGGVLTEGGKDSFWVGAIRYTYSYEQDFFIAEDELSYIVVLKNENNHTNYGVSPLLNLVTKMDWIQEYENRNTNNIATGINANKIISPKERIDVDDMDLFESKYRTRGSKNGIMWTPFEIGEVVDIGQNTSDLDTYEKYEQAIYNVYHIPSPMLMANNQTFNNFPEAIEQYTEEAILPVIGLLKAGLNDVILRKNPTFKGLNLKLTKNSMTLQKQKLERMILAMETESLTINEIRAEGGYSDIGVAGDVINNKNGFM